MMIGREESGETHVNYTREECVSPAQINKE